MGLVAQTYPSFHGIDGRSFALAFIIVLHMGFFYAFTAGLVPPLPIFVNNRVELVPVDHTEPSDERPPKPLEPDIRSSSVVSPIPIADDFRIESTDWVVPVQPSSGSGPVAVPEPQPAPQLVEPRIDPRVGLREPVYPPPEIRANHSGTVVLSVEVLPNGKVGAVRVARSSGYPRLDEAALKVAREWRLIPGTRDGVAVAMWKEIPITFQLRN